MAFSQNLSPKVRAELATKTLIPLVGPSSVGKTAVMRTLEQMDPDFHRSSGFTTREPREGEDPTTYRFLGNEPETRNEIIRKFQNGEVIQFVIHPTTGHLYGTSLADYRGKYNMLDMLSSEVDSFRSIGFKDIRIIMLVVKPEDWQKRFDSNHFPPEEAIKRIQEGITSLSWGIEQHHSVRWLINKEDELAETVDHLRAIINNEFHEADDNAKQTGLELLEHLKRRQFKQ
jgi:guanylate kinase